MAQVKQEGQKNIEKLLELSRAAWEELPEVATEIDEWDADSQLTYVVEWPLEYDRLHQLGRYAKHGLMTEEQSRRYRELKELVAKNRPILDQILRN